MSEFEDRIGLESLDPASRDPGFWLRFHDRVMAQARGELARRRMTTELSVVDVVFAWRRALVPMTLMAAAVAGLLLKGYEQPEPVEVVALEEVLTEGLNLFPVASVLSSEGATQPLVFAGAEGGF